MGVVQTDSVARGVLPVWDSEDEQDLIRELWGESSQAVRLWGGRLVMAVQGWWCGGWC